MKNISNNHGFTLVELLAVIVVLAIVMLLAVQAVLPQMEKARRQTLALDAQTAIEAANTYFMNKSLSDPENGFPTSGSKCVSLNTLITQGYFTAKGTYKGSVQVIKQTSSNNYLFKVWLQKDKLYVAGAGSDESTNTKIVAADNETDENNDVKTYSNTPTAAALENCGTEPSGGSGGSGGNG